jgi:D-sedoheptulose 7-phosphate isomerase
MFTPLNFTVMIDAIKANFIEARNVLDAFIHNDDNWKNFESAGNIMVNAIRSGKKIISCGNGGSLCDAMHFAEELSGRFRDDRPAMPAIAISDASHITCVSNDYGYEAIFSRFVEGLGNEGDVLLGISTSGNSVNIIKAAEAARKKGMKIVCLTGRTGGKLANLCDVELRAPMSEYADRAQEIHIKIIHSLIQYIEIQMQKRD